MKIELGFGYGTQTAEIPDELVMGILTPNPVVHSGKSESELVREALANPMDSLPLEQRIHPGDKVVIVTSDVTRPMPTSRVMPALMETLEAAGVRDEDVTVVFAVGSHRKQSEEEKKHLVGDEAYRRYTCEDSDPDDVIDLGVTSRGTPVKITRRVAEADFRICLGNVEYHYFAGYSGGDKAIMPGCSTREAIECNHSHMVEAGACAGQLAGNPIREDIEEAAKLCPADFILNVVLDEHKRIIGAFAGDHITAHRTACQMIDRLYMKKIPEKADIVLVSQGGAPKDLNLYQTQKALDNAKHAVKPGGTVVLVGSCREGMGEKTFGEWMTDGSSPQELIARTRAHFKLGGHKAAAIALVAEQAEVCLVSEMPTEMVGNTFLRHFATLEEAAAYALGKTDGKGKVLVMPYGGSTLPRSE